MSKATRNAARTLVVGLMTLALAGAALAQDGGQTPGLGIAPGVTPGVTKAAPQAPTAGLINDYPTVARADYIFGCMAANGQSRPALEKCSCSIDTIATILPYEKYQEAETILRMVQVPGQASEVFRSTGMFRDIVAEMRRAQAEAEVTCFY